VLHSTHHNCPGRAARVAEKAYCSLILVSLRGIRLGKPFEPKKIKLHCETAALNWSQNNYLFIGSLVEHNYVFAKIVKNWPTLQICCSVGMYWYVYTHGKQNHPLTKSDQIAIVCHLIQPLKNAGPQQAIFSSNGTGI
jgi:hypothetical protein